MYNQYDSRWKNVKLGTSNSTIGMYGCNLTCIAQGLVDHNYNYTPATLNQLFIQTASYTNGNLINPATIAAKNPRLFTAGYSEAWSDAKVKQYMQMHDDYIIIGEVDARGIGGSGQHFVLLIDLVLTPEGKISNTLIGDPWGGLEQLVTIRYAKYGCIKSLRVYRVNRASSGNQQSNNQTDNNNSSGEQNMEASQYNYFLDVDSYQAGERKLIEHLGINGDHCAWGDASGDGGGYLGSERRKVYSLEGENQSIRLDRDQWSAKAQDLDAINIDLQKQLDTSERVVGEQKTRLNQLYENIHTLQNQIKDLEAGQSAEIEALKSEIELKDETIEDLQATIKHLKEQSGGNCEQRPLWEQIVERLKELFA